MEKIAAGVPPKTRNMPIWARFLSLVALMGGDMLSTQNTPMGCVLGAQIGRRGRQHEKRNHKLCFSCLVGGGKLGVHRIISKMVKNKKTADIPCTLAFPLFPLSCSLPEPHPYSIVLSCTSVVLVVAHS